GVDGRVAGQGALVEQHPVRVGDLGARRDDVAVVGGGAARERVDGAPVEHGGAAPEDEVDVAFDVAVPVVLARRHGHRRAVRVQRVLVAEEAAVVERRAVAAHAAGDGLGAAHAGVVGAEPVVREGDGAGGEAGAVELHRGGTGGADG
ncbi:hypothetical protein ADL26_11505, partial [Thermoactinomyces vulgaris]